MKNCEQCKRAFARRKSEAFYQYESRKFCSRRCRGLFENPPLPAGQFKARYRKVKTPDGRNLLEHRWVMEQAIGRPLARSEQRPRPDPASHDGGLCARDHQPRPGAHPAHRLPRRTQARGCLRRLRDRGGGINGG